MKSLWIRWTKKDSKNYVDIIPWDLFGSDIEIQSAQHLIRRPVGTTYIVKCSVSVRGNVAPLTYKEEENRPNTVWPGTTRILFENDRRTDVHLVEWQDAGDTK